MELPIPKSDYARRLGELVTRYKGEVKGVKRGKHLKLLFNGRLVVVSTSPRDPSTALKKIESDIRKTIS